MTQHEKTFRADDTYTLISRLRQNVIKTGLRTMSLTYSRISLRDVCLKLGLDSEETTEYIVAKAIRDGVIEATINHEGGYMQNREVLDVYATEEPLLAFDERIRFCMSLHNEAIKVNFTPFFEYWADDRRCDFRQRRQGQQKMQKSYVKEKRNLSRRLRVGI